MKITVETDTHLYFWGGIYSNWYPVDFIVDGIKFNCSEQYMMFSKARHFNDARSAALIMDTSEPKLQKSLGRQVENFNPVIWSAVGIAYTFKGCLQKFRQNDILKDEILATGNKILVEGSPYDKIWGVGLAWNNPKILDENNWDGSNFLGQVLMNVREALS